MAVGWIRALVSCLFAFYLVHGASVPEARYDTIVVGLGSSGTTAASTLAAAGKRVLALEAQDRIGGRVHTVKFGNGVVELGAEWIHGSEKSRVYDAAMEYNITVLTQSYQFMTFQSDSSMADDELMKEIFHKGMSIYLEGNGASSTGGVGSYVTREWYKYINATRPDLLDDKDFVDEFLEFLNLVVDTYDATDDWNDASTASRAEELGGEQALSWNTYGYKTFFDILLKKYNNGPGYPNLEMQFNKEVTKISWSDDGVTVSCKDGTEYKADNVIVTVSAGVLKETHSTIFSPALSQEKVEALGRTKMGVMDKISFSFDKPFWPSEYSFFAFIWKKDDKKAVPAEDRWLTKIDGASATMGSNNVLTLWVTGSSAKMVESLPEDVLKRKSMELLRRFVGKKFDVPEPSGMIRSTWYTNPFTRGTYTYDDHIIVNYPETRPILAKPLLDSTGRPRVLFAGEATNERHFGTVHGASETGYREAMRILDGKVPL